MKKDQKIREQFKKDFAQALESGDLMKVAKLQVSCSMSQLAYLYGSDAGAAWAAKHLAGLQAECESLTEADDEDEATVLEGRLQAEGFFRGVQLFLEKLKPLVIKEPSDLLTATIETPSKT